MKIMTLDDLYLEQLQDMHSCERQLIKSLPKLAEAASHPQLKAAFDSHLAQTRTHLERLDGIIADLGKSPGKKVCEATVGLVEEGAGMIAAEADPEVRDAGLICAAQKTEHYEIASYGCLRTFATVLGRTTDAATHQQTLDEEKAADRALTELAMGGVNVGALS